MTTASEVQALKDRIEQLEEVLGIDRSTTGRIREALGIDPIHAVIVGVLLSRKFVTRDGLYTVLYGARPEAEWPEEGQLDVLMCRLRPRLEAKGLTVETKYGEGWSMSKADKAKLNAMLNGPDDAVPVLSPKDTPPLAPGALDDFEREKLRKRRLAFLDGH